MKAVLLIWHDVQLEEAPELTWGDPNKTSCEARVVAYRQVCVAEGEPYIPVLLHYLQD
jgi:hypothetical protein